MLLDHICQLAPGFAEWCERAEREWIASGRAPLEPDVFRAMFRIGWAACHENAEVERERARLPGRPSERSSLPWFLFNAFFSHVGEPWNPSDDGPERERIEQRLGREVSVRELQTTAARLSRKSPDRGWRIEKVGKHERRSGGSWRLMPADPESRTRTFPTLDAYKRARGKYA